jgi:acetyltransferase
MTTANDGLRLALLMEDTMASNALDPVIAGDQEAFLITRAGIVLKVRPVTVDDGPLLAGFFERVDIEDLHFRFLSGQDHPRPDQIAQMIEVDHRRAEHLLAFDAETSTMVASAFVAVDGQMDCAEIAISVAKDYRARGIGWTLLKHVAELAKVHGVKRLRSIESRQNHAALEVERALGFSATDYDGDPTLVLIEAQLN